MRRLRIMIVGLLCLPSAVMAQGPGRDATVEAWFDAWGRGLQRTTKDAERAILVRVTTTTTTTVSAEEADALWERVKTHPDHPDRARVERIRALRQAPRVVHIEAVYAQSSSWAYRTQTEGGWTISAGGDPEQRWGRNEPPPAKPELAGRANLVLTRMGIPYPAGRNPAAFFDDCRVEVERWLYEGLPSDTWFDSIQPVSGGWVVRLKPSPGGIKYAMQFSPWREPGRVVVTRVGFIKRGADSPNPEFEWTLALSGHEPGPQGRLIPRRIVDTAEAGFVRTSVLEAVEEVPFATLAESARPPEPVLGSKVYDFTITASPAWEEYAESARVVWYNRQDSDTYETRAPLRAPSQSTVDAAAPRPEPPRTSAAWFVGTGIVGVTGGVALWKSRKVLSR